MKKYVTEKAIEKLVSKFARARHNQREAQDQSVREYFLGKMIGQIEAFAALCNLNWLHAEAILRVRADALEKE